MRQPFSAYVMTVMKGYRFVFVYFFLMIYAFSAKPEQDVYID